MTPPKRIYLQADSNFPVDTGEEVTWCVDEINDTDTEYVRLDVYEELRAENAALRSRLDACCDELLADAEGR